MYSIQTRSHVAGCSESSYYGTFNRLDSEKILGKLVTLRSASEEWPEQTYPIPCLNVDRLLVPQCYHTSSQQLTPLSVASLEVIPTNGGLVSPQSPVRNGSRYVDPKYVSL